MNSIKNSYHLFYYVSLIFLIYPIIAIVSGYLPIWHLGLMILFVLSYLYLVIKGSERYHVLTWFYMLGYTVFMCYAFNIGIIWYFFYSSNLLIYRFRDPIKHYRPISFILAIGFLVIYQLLFGSTSDETIFTIFVSLFILSFYFISLRIQNEEKQKAVIEQKNAYINVLMAENERNRIGRDLHDTLGHVFAMMTIKSELALKQLEKGETVLVEKELKELHQMSKESMSEVRSIINNLKFRTVIEELETIENLFELANIKLTIDNQINLDNLSPVIQSTLTMLIRELANNIIKHSKAKSSCIHLYRKDSIILVVEDDGVGFSSLKGNELASVKDRLKLVNGSLDIVSLRQPTRIQIALKEGIKS
ncbi:sensor histidine kinase [Streptococcus sp. CSL10205-OR2]|uniref:sensor histidine kinase n=1 Tax=Streptococcus sp. CSL10205-OR2 TaxID=2980558 RepID=UPI0021DA4367|nr:sensor histidine kinase [Streptococcus sp. CSL10205-OR2]MCU9533904.1 sensor histidine kinase [Streptococcus sp. CSL10205-OR2]